MPVRTIAKHRYFSGKRAKRSAKEYTNYVCYRRGEDREEGGRRFFGSERDDIKGREVLDRLDEFEQGRGVMAHELILSPGLNTVDPQDYTRELMDKLERSKGQELEWVAVAHKGDHNHIHVLVMGKDERGCPVKINRNDYKDLRQWGDRYLEREHDLERFLDRGPQYERSFDVNRDVQERQKGDELFNSLFGKGDVSKERTPAQEKEKEKEPEPVIEWNKERTIAELDDSEKIYRKHEAYSKFSSLDELKGLDAELQSGSVERIPKGEYAQLKRWIDEKEKYGEDYHERQEKDKVTRDEKERAKNNDQYVREFQEIDKRLKEAYTDRSERGGISRPMGRQQRIHEQRGQQRLLDAHGLYTRNMEEKRLKDAMERDPENRERYEKELEAFVEAYRQEQAELERSSNLGVLFGWKDKERGEDQERKEPGKERTEEPGREGDGEEQRQTQQQTEQQETQEQTEQKEPDKDQETRDREEREQREREETEREDRNRDDDRGGR